MVIDVIIPCGDTLSIRVVIINVLHALVVGKLKQRRNFVKNDVGKWTELSMLLDIVFRLKTLVI